MDSLYPSVTEKFLEITLEPYRRQFADEFVLEPTTTAWMYQNEKHVDQIGDQFQSLLLSLERAQVEYDLGSEDIIARQGSADGLRLVVGQRRYQTIVLPPLAENLNLKTVELLESCLQAGTPSPKLPRPAHRPAGSTAGRQTARIAETAAPAASPNTFSERES